jgi:hypothetical protein
LPAILAARLIPPPNRPRMAINPIQIDPSVLTSAFNVKAGIGGSSTGAAGTTAAKPTPPWLLKADITPAAISDLVRNVLIGGHFIDTDAAKLTVPVSDKSTASNYKTLFGLYQGLVALNGLADLAAGKNVSAYDQTRYQKAFANGLTQMQGFLDHQPFEGFDVVQGKVSTSLKSTIGAKTGTDSYTTGTIYTGKINGEVPAFQGNVTFGADVTKGGTLMHVDFDLSEMDPAARTMGNVVNYMNGKMKDAGISTRFANVRTPGKAQTVTVGKSTVTLSPGPDTFALQIKGNSVEKVTLIPTTSVPAIFLAQGSGSKVGPSPDAQQQLLKFDTSSNAVQTAPGDGLVFQRALDANLSNVKGTATAADGSVYVLGTVSGTVAGQVIQGPSDLALMKYDSAGNLLFTRTLGAEGAAQGLTLAVSADGSQVAVAGSVKGALDSTDTKPDAASTDMVVTVFDKAGQELWTQRAGAPGADDTPASVAFAANGTVYVAGQTNGTVFAGGGKIGSTDNYVMGFSATKKPLYDGTGAFAYSPKQVSRLQYGSTGVDRNAGMVVSGTNLLVAGVENGHAVVRRYDISSGKPVLAATRDLGDLQGGDVAGLALQADGSIVVAGSTHNGALAVGTPTQPYVPPAKAAFVASLAGDLTSQPTDALTYVGGAKDQTATAVTVSGGKVYLAGTISTGVKTVGKDVVPLSDGFVSQIDPVTGQTTWSRQYSGRGSVAAPTGIAVSAAGSSILDKLGLPSGAVDYSASDQVVANTSARAGDGFYVRAGQTGAAKLVTIAANDTYKTLATKISRALGFQATITTMTISGVTQLQIKPIDERRPIELQGGPPGRDALSSLGIAEGLVTTDALTAKSHATGSQPVGAIAATNKLKGYYSLQLPSSLTLTSANEIKQAQSALQLALSTVRTIYGDMTTVPAVDTTKSGPVPTYITKQAQQYQAALDRLTGGGG